MIEANKTQRVGLLATTGIKQVAARRVLERINESCKIVFAISDRDWMLEGAAVRISMVGYAEAKALDTPVLDGKQVVEINADLTVGCDLTQARMIAANRGLCFMGTTKVGAFDIELERARAFLLDPNPTRCPNSNVLRPFRNGGDLVQGCSDRWIIDFGVSSSMQDAAAYSAPFEFVVKHVKPERAKNNRKSRAEKWWLLGETLPAFRKAVSGLQRFIGTPRVSKHRVFVWLDATVLPDSKVIAVAASDDATLGVLHSRLHLLWTSSTSSLHGGERPTYNPTLSFETFPFPEPTQAQQAAIAAAAQELDRLRTNWLNPPEWTREEVLAFPGSADGPWARYVHDPDRRGIGTVRYPRLVAKDPDCAKLLAKRTLTNLYNQRPTWLDLAHRKLDEAVFAAYGWEAEMGEEEILARLLALNLKRAGK